MKRIVYNNKYRILKLYYQGVSPSILLKEYHVPSSTFYYWVTKYPKETILFSKDNGRAMGQTHRYSHYRKLEQELAFLHRTLLKDLPLSYKMEIVDREYGKESLHVQCEALGLNRSTYLNHKYRNKNENTWYKKREAEYSEVVKSIYEESGHVYGARKIAAIMRRRGKFVSDEYVRRLMSELGLRSNRSAADKDYRLVARHLREAGQAASNYNPTAINQVWVSDTTAVTVHHRYYYVCVYVDLYSRKVVGWNIGRNNSTRLVKRTFISAYSSRKPVSLIVHTDNGACYTSYSFEKLLKEYGVSHSYSRPHAPHDNAVAESFFNTLKREGIFLNGYPKSLHELQENVVAFIERYNSIRPHEHLEYLSPDEFETAQDE